jgi:hypothetical protein
MAVDTFLLHMRYFLLLWCIVGCCIPLRSQTTDSLPAAADSLAPARHGFIHRFFKQDYPNPRKALLFSIIPGGGQIYNKKWWKLPIAYGALGTVMYFEINNIRQYRNLRDNYRAQVDGDPDTNPTKFPTNLKAEDMKAYRDIYKRYVELNSVVLGLTYLLTVTDAFVDAHLASFDVSEDLSMKPVPSFESTPSGAPAIGLGLRFTWGVSKP